MFAVLSVREPKSQETTRLVFGCIEPAEAVGTTLLNCGYDVEAETLPIAPVRSDEERQRAERLTMLIMEPAEGSA